MIPALIAASLTNDIFSYQKEYEDAKKAGHADVVNAVWIMMGETHISEEEAKLLCRKRIKEEIKRYVQTVEEVKIRNDISEDLRKYIEVMQYSLSGNVVWSLQCPRYHKNTNYNDLQLLRAKHGIAKFPARWPLKDENLLPTQEDLKHTIQNGAIHSNGIKSSSNGPKMKDFTPNGVQTNGTEPHGISNGVKSSVNEDQGRQPRLDTFSNSITEDCLNLVLDTKLSELSDAVSVIIFGSLPNYLSQPF